MKPEIKTGEEISYELDGSTNDEKRWIPCEDEVKEWYEVYNKTNVALALLDELPKSHARNSLELHLKHYIRNLADKNINHLEGK